METPTADQLLEMMRAYQIPCILGAAADLGLFEKMADGPQAAANIAEDLMLDLRAVSIILDALAAIRLVHKSGDDYTLASGLAPFLAEESPQSVIDMIRHQSTCLRRWTKLAWTARSGKPQEREPSVRGAEADEAAFIGAMHAVSHSVAGPLIREINPGGFQCVLDIGGASGSWTAAWLEAEPLARAIIFDLPHVIPMAQRRISQLGISDRVEMVAGDFYTDQLPGGADLVWLSAIIHQNSPDQNQALFSRIAEAMQPGGWIYIRDIVLEPSRTAPVAGALFAVNMLTATVGGNSYTLEEIEQGLTSAGFSNAELIRRDEGMHSVVRAQINGSQALSD